ncbi:unnamed protein product [Calypogeia fissa]
MASLVCTGQLVGGAVSAPAGASRTASNSSTCSAVSAAPCGGVLRSRMTVGNRRNVMTMVAFSSRSALSGSQLMIGSIRGHGGKGRVGAVEVRGYKGSSDVVGEDPDWSEDDYIVVGLAHCFRKDEDQKLLDAFVIEPIPAGQLECMDNGGVTCYKHAASTTLGVALQLDASLLPKEFGDKAFCENFDFRAKCASRTWKRDHPRENLMSLVPTDGSVRSDWNFSMKDKRILNEEHIVKDSDNIKQDMSIDVYGRTEKEEEMTSEISQLYNV